MLKLFRKRPLVLLVAILVTWSPATISQPSAADCAAEADRASRDSGSTLGGVGRGATGGALFGAVVGGKKSAKRGAALGGVVGGVKRGAQKNDVYNSVYDACMRR